MVEKEIGGSRRHGAGGWKVWMAAALLAGLVALGGWLSYGRWYRASAWEQLVAINRTHLLDPRENAAAVYNRLVVKTEWWLAALAAFDPNEKITSGPWGPSPVGNTIPDEAIAAITSTLQEAARYEKCYFSLTDQRRVPAAAIGEAMQITAWSARADLQAGRAAAAQEKLEAIIRTACHLAQQARMGDLLLAWEVETCAWRAVHDLICRGEATREQLSMIEALVPPLRDSWRRETALARRVEELLLRMETEQATVREKFTNLWLGTDHRYSHLSSYARNAYLRLLADRRGIRLLIALRRYENTTGAWPRRLEDLRENVPREACNDPFRPARPLLYQAAGEDFLLYCRGPDGLDQSGQGDDWQIWPRGKVIPEKLQGNTP